MMENTPIPSQTDVLIVGGGPVGLTASLLLSRYRIPHLIVEQRHTPTHHPQAHFISCRSMEIFRELGGMAERIREASAPLDEWRHYVYCTDLAGLPESYPHKRQPSGSLLGAVDHFPEGPDHTISPTWESNLPQHVLVRLLRQSATDQPFARLLEGYRADVRERPRVVEVKLTAVNTGQALSVQCRYVICADGARSTSRRALGMRRLRQTSTLQHLINVHFFSPELADQLRRRIMGMLYFVYSRHGIGVFVNHSLQRGEFVLQLPYFPPLQDAAAFTSAACADLIAQLAGLPIESDIRDIQPWRLGAWVVERFHSPGRRCFLVGDAAHQVLPAGGFGLNCGLADAHNLIWKLALALRKPHHEPGDGIHALLTTYDRERRPVAEEYLDQSKANFIKTLAVGSAIGLDWRAARWMARIVRLAPAPNFIRRKVFQLGMRLGLGQVRLLDSDNLVGRTRRRDVAKLFATPAHSLAMRFPRQDLGFVYDSGRHRGLRHWRRQEDDASSFEPDFIPGGRLPHFWLKPAGVTTSDPVSSIDLPVLAARKHGAPVDVMLVFDLGPDAADRLIARGRSPSTPVALVRIHTSLNPCLTADYVLATKPPLKLPSPGAVRVRPDGHLAQVLADGGEDPKG